jgi:hypothetical protein
MPGVRRRPYLIACPAAGPGGGSARFTSAVAMFTSMRIFVDEQSAAVVAINFDSF